ncbi:hypothetical protein BX600DRAFT_155556 [Xylariales sp. PMI_506]|nr:hypothetical protein BX600DRAFT_155556 [Xylariales sp. PMI_506]
MADPFASSGGFLPASLPSPAPSSASTRALATLPHPRSKPLLPGSRKEDYAREYVSRRLLHVSRRFVKKHGMPQPGDEVAGYESFDEVCRDLDEVVDVLWFSGTPSLQVPYLLNVALAVTEYLPSFPPASRPTFSLLRKLDHCFASLLAGHDARTGEPLPGFLDSAGRPRQLRPMTRTDMVRCKSLADDTRVQVALKMSNEPDVETYLPEDDQDGYEAAGGGGGNTVAGSASGSYETGTKRKADDMEADSTPKRQKTESPPHGIKRERSPALPASSTPRAVKTEEGSSDDEGVLSYDGSPGISTAGASRNQDDAAPGGGPDDNNIKGQFHWALDEDDDDDDDDDEDKATPTAAPSVSQSHAGSVPQTPQQRHHRLLQQISTPPPGATDHPGGDADDAGPEETEDQPAEEEDDDDDDGGDDGGDENDEDEELQMNVAKVYEKTITQLGKVLGEPILSIVDDRPLTG